jgi:hypothetical protein
MRAIILAMLAITMVGGCKITRDDPRVAACTMLQDVYDCRDLDSLPTIEYFPQDPFNPGLRGYYLGGDKIYVRTGMTRFQEKATIFHEMVHYMQVKLGGLSVPGPAYTICRAEAEAFMWTDRYLTLVLGRDWATSGDDWWKAYDHCYDFYGET